MEPILNGEVEEDDVRTLWKRIEPKLKAALSTVYLREVTRFVDSREITQFLQFVYF